MKRGLLLSIGTLAGAIGLAAGTSNAGLTAMNHEFTYQGRLDIAGVPFNGVAQFEFRIFDSAVGGAVAPAPAPPVLVVPAVSVVAGVFTVNLNYGATAFIGDQRFLDIRVDTTAPYGDAYTTLTPRQLLRTTPYASFALSAGSIAGVVPIANGGTSAITPAAAISNLTAGAMTLNGANIDVTASLFAGAGNSVQLTNNQVSTFGSDGLEQIRLWGSGFGEILLHDATAVDNDQTVVLSATSNAGGSLILRDATGTFNTANLLNEATGGRLYLRDEAGQLQTSMGGATAGGVLQIYQSNGTTLGMNVDGDATGLGGGGALTVYQSDGSTGVFLDGDNGTNVGGRINVNDAASAARVILLGQSTNTGGEISVLDDTGNETVEVLGAGGAGGGQVALRNNAGAQRALLGLESTGEGQFLLYNQAGLITIEIDADYASTGDGRIITDELQITGGSDLSEQFDIAADNAELTPEPGMVVCINPDSPGDLMISAKAYDRCVAGIISGANGIKPGMLMGQKNTEANGRHPVALTGRVYVRVTEANGSIEPGDLLTSSDAPGKAMKVTDFVKAQGAIIGKAMTRMDDNGMVLVLVGLQ